MTGRFQLHIIDAARIELREQRPEPIRMFVVNCDRLAPLLLCAVLKASVGTALRIFRDPGLRSPLGRGAVPILIAGCGGKLCASFSKNAWRFGHNI